MEAFKKHEFNEIPKREYAGSDNSDEVLIDLSGDGEKFVMGYYSFEWRSWFKADNADIVDNQNMTWMYLPMAKYNKATVIHI